MNYLELYFTSLKNLQRSPRTIETYENCLNQFENYLVQNHSLSLANHSVHNIKGFHILGFMESKSVSLGTYNLYVTVIKTYFTFLIRAGILPSSHNPSLILRVKRKRVDEVEDEKRYFANIYTTSDIQNVFASLGSTNRLRNQTILSILFATGLRASELCSLTFGDIRNMKNNTFACIRKGGGRYRVPMGNFAMPYVERWLARNTDKKDSDPLFMTQEGNPLSRHSLYTIVSNVQKKIGKPTGVHKLRHAFLSELQRSCGNMALVRDVASHSNSRITDLYTHTSMQGRVDAVNSITYQE